MFEKSIGETWERSVLHHHQLLPLADIDLGDCLDDLCKRTHHHQTPPIPNSQNTLATSSAFSHSVGHSLIPVSAQSCRDLHFSKQPNELLQTASPSASSKQFGLSVILAERYSLRGIGHSTSSKSVYRLSVTPSQSCPRHGIPRPKKRHEPAIQRTRLCPRKLIR